MLTLVFALDKADYVPLSQKRAMQFSLQQTKPQEDGLPLKRQKTEIIQHTDSLEKMVAEKMANVASMIDHTLLKDETKEKIKKICDDAHEYGFYSVCVRPQFVGQAFKLLNELGSKTVVITVVNFPTGEPDKDVVALVKKVIKDGAKEIDMVINVKALKEGNQSVVIEGIEKIVKAASDVPVKVILETAELTDDEIIAGCKAAEYAGAKFVKTSTGFSEKGGATFHAVRLMKETVGNRLQIKASGGIKDAQKVKDMVMAGADRIGTSSGIDIVNGNKRSTPGAY